MEIGVLLAERMQRVFEFLNVKLFGVEFRLELIDCRLVLVDFFLFILDEIVEFLNAVLAFRAFPQTFLELPLQAFTSFLQFTRAAIIVHA